MVKLEISGATVTINQGQIVEGGSQELQALVKPLAEQVGHPAASDPDYRFAEMLIDLTGGRIVKHIYSDYNPGEVY